jgi:hypothetical protein
VEYSIVILYIFIIGHACVSHDRHFDGAARSKLGVRAGLRERKLLQIIVSAG